MNGTQHSSTHPPPHTPPEDDSIDRLRLLRSYRVGISTYRRLMKEHGNAKTALAALPEVARTAGVKNYQTCSTDTVLAEIKKAKNQKAFLVDEACSLYPKLLSTVDDAPPFLWAIGDPALLSRPAIAIVGARNASSLGTRMAKKLAAELGEAGFVVVSGLARGIDAAAHLGALETGTIAVQAGGVETVYPTENAALAADIAQQGLRISEMPMGLQPRAQHFPRRNRIISGLAQAAVVIEAASKSGSLITARNALDQNRDVLAVPGHPFDARAAGCNMLLRDGATLVRGATDVIEALQKISEPTKTPQPMAKKKSTLRDTNRLHQEILQRLGPNPVAEDQLIRDLESQAHGVGPALVELELTGHIVRQAGGLVARAS